MHDNTREIIAVAMRSKGFTVLDDTPPLDEACYVSCQWGRDISQRMAL